MTLTLLPLGKDEFSRVAHISVAPRQERFSGTVAEAFAADNRDVDFHAICHGETPVGFFKIDRAYAERHHFARAGDLGLRAFLIDEAHQGRGIGTAAVRALHAYLPTRYPATTGVVLTVNMSNPAAKACYRRGGFADTGEIWEGGQAGPQLVMRLDLTP